MAEGEVVATYSFLAVLMMVLWIVIGGMEAMTRGSSSRGDDGDVGG